LPSTSSHLGSNPPESISYVPSQPSPSFNAYSSAPPQHQLAPPTQLPYDNMASPAPSHRSIPGLSGGWMNDHDREMEQEIEDGGDDRERRGGPLRVMNEEPWQAGGNGAGSPYNTESLTEGLYGQRRQDY
ncbi:hypothetical protein P7C70_g3056, partial [Phenoliferia sp. Uapishka_3]